MTVDQHTVADGISLTEVAAAKVRQLLEVEGVDDLALRISVAPGGCSGLRYQLALDDRELDGEGMRTQLVAALGAESHARDGDVTSLWFDPARLMVFDPETGDNLTYDEEAARKADEDSVEERKRATERARKRAERTGERSRDRDSAA